MLRIPTGIELHLPLFCDKIGAILPLFCDMIYKFYPYFVTKMEIFYPYSVTKFRYFTLILLQIDIEPPLKISLSFTQ
jgi:hypothetical protein